MIMNKVLNSHHNSWIIIIEMNKTIKVNLININKDNNNKFINNNSIVNKNNVKNGMNNHQINKINNETNGLIMKLIN